MSIAWSVGVFSETTSEDNIFGIGASVFESEDVVRMKTWKVAMEESKRPVASFEDNIKQGKVGGVTNMSQIPGNQNENGNAINVGDILQTPPTNDINVLHLKTDQYCTYSIITSHLHVELQDQKPSRLLMQLTGEGGTGKSKVIQMVTEAFEKLGAHMRLLKGAYTRIAACSIRGATLHSLCGVPVRGKQPSMATLSKLVIVWQNIWYLIIDEYSMISRTFLAWISSTLSLIMDHIQGHVEDLPFGGINVIICGDFHQFPPVCSQPLAPLYWPASMDELNDDTMGSKLYLKFTIVIILKEQVRVTDTRWLDLLCHAQHGTCSAEHLSLLWSLQLGGSECPVTDFTSSPWSNTVLVIPCHSVQNQWNVTSSKQTTHAMRTQLYICVKGRGYYS